MKALLAAVWLLLMITVGFFAEGGSRGGQTEVVPVLADPCALAEPATGSSCDNPGLNPGPRPPDPGPPAPVPPIPGVDAPPNPAGGDINAGDR